MRKPSLTLAILLLACGDDATPSDTNDETEGTTSDTSEPSTSASTSGMSTSTTASTTASTTEPETSSSTSEESSTTMGPEPACGDGNMDEGEECDDGNTDQDDACTAMCTVPFEVEWTVSYNGPASNMDGTEGVLVDGEGNIVVVGFHRTLDDAYDVWLQQYAPDGSELWNFTWSAGLGLNDVGTGLAFHPSGDVIIAGYTESVVDDNDVLLMRVPFDGTEPTWVMTYDGPGMGKEDFDNADSANAVEVDGNGDIVVVGNERVDGERSNVLVRKHDGDGELVWMQTYNGAESESDTCADVVVDAANNIYVACNTVEAAGPSTGWIRRYDENGTVDWTEQTPWLPAGMTLDADENLLITGFVDAGTIDIIVNKYDSMFTEIWSQTINGPSAGGDFGRDLVADADGNVYVIAGVAVTDQQDDIYVHKFDVDGNDQWAYAYNNDEADLGDYGTSIAVDPDGNVYVTGDETVLGQQRNAWITKIVQD